MSFYNFYPKEINIQPSPYYDAGNSMPHLGPDGPDLGYYSWASAWRHILPNDITWDRTVIAEPILYPAQAQDFAPLMGDITLAYPNSESIYPSPPHEATHIPPAVVGHRPKHANRSAHIRRAASKRHPMHRKHRVVKHASKTREFVRHAPKHAPVHVSAVREPAHIVPKHEPVQILPAIQNHEPVRVLSSVSSIEQAQISQLSVSTFDQASVSKTISSPGHATKKEDIHYSSSQTRIVRYASLLKGLMSRRLNLGKDPKIKPKIGD